MNIGKLEKANELHEKIADLKEKIDKVEIASSRNVSLALSSFGYEGVYIPDSHKQTILALAKSLMETDLQKLQAEFDAL